MAGGRGRLERCEIFANLGHGVSVTVGGHPILTGCIIRDHTVGRGCGVAVYTESQVLLTIYIDLCGWGPVRRG